MKMVMDSIVMPDPAETGHPNPYWLAVRKQATGEVKSVRDLKGKKLAMTVLQSSTEWAADRMLAAEGLKLSDVEILALPQPDMLPALKNGSVDAAMAVEPFLSPAVADGSVVKL